MSIIGTAVIAVVMICAVAGAIASLFDDQKGLGKEFLEGLHAIGYIFVPVAGIMASIPYLSRLIRAVVGPAFASIGADPAMAATTFIAVDMGGYQLAQSLADTKESWIMAMMAGYMAGATIVFSIPVGLTLLEKRDHKYMALGVMAGILSVPVGIFISSLVLILLGPSIRSTAVTAGPADYTLHLSVQTVLLNLAPMVVFVALLALGLRLIPEKMIRGFMLFGRVLDGAIKIVLVLCIVEHFTGVFSLLLGSWGFDPIIADDRDLVRALEVAGYIGIMLSGAFPMVYLIKMYLAEPVRWLGEKVGLESTGAAGIMATIANILAMFRLVREMRPKDKVLNIAFAVCAAFLFGDHLAFTANFQPNLILPVMLGKFGGGICGFCLAYWLSVPMALKLEKEDVEAQIRSLFPLVPELQDKQVTITVLGGGLTNRNYRLDTEDNSYVLRIAGHNTGLLGIDRESEVACARAAAAAGVGPDVVAYLPEHSALVARFVKGHGVKTEDIQQPQMLRRVAETLRRCHDYPVPPGVGTFSPFAVVRTYHALAQERGLALPEDLGPALDRLGRIERELHTGELPCLCHNDLLPANLIDDGVIIRIIDWEWGGVGDRLFDLGNLAVNCQLDEDQEWELLTAYFGEATPEQLRRLRLMRLASDMREAIWGFLQAGISKVKPPEEYLAYGRKHLDRFLAAAAALEKASGK